MPSTSRSPIMTISSTAVSRAIGVSSSIAVPALSIAASHASGARSCAGGDLAAAARHAAMRAGADPEIIPVAPIGEIVPAFGAGPGMVRNFVSRQSGRREPMLRQLEQRGGGVLVGRPASRRARRGCRSAVPGSIVNWYSDRCSPASASASSAPHPRRQASGRAGHRSGRTNSGGKCRGARRIAAIASSRSCRAAEKPQRLGVERLNAERQPVDPGRGEAAKRSASAEFGLASSVISRSGAAGHSALHPLDQRRRPSRAASATACRRRKRPSTISRSGTSAA